MGIEASYRRITLDELNQLQHPETADTFFGSNFNLDDEDAFLPRYSISNERYLNIGKDWQAIHFLLTGEVAFVKESCIPPPLCNLVMGGTETELEATYGRVRFLTPDQVEEVAEALSQVAQDELRLRLNPEAFNKAEIYPGHDEWDEEELEPLLEIYRKLIEFFDKAAHQGDVILLSFS